MKTGGQSQAGDIIERNSLYTIVPCLIYRFKIGNDCQPEKACRSNGRFSDIQKINKICYGI